MPDTTLVRLFMPTKILPNEISTHLTALYPIDGLFPWAEADPEQTAQAGRWLDALEVPQAQRPIAGQCLTWEIRQNDDPRDTLLAFWDREVGRLFILESFL